jgi:hypothetical protein
MFILNILDDLPLWLAKAMNTLLNWEMDDEEFPKFFDVFQEISKYFANLNEPLLTNELSDLFLNIFSSLIIPKLEDLNFSKFSFDINDSCEANLTEKLDQSKCEHLTLDTSKYVYEDEAKLIESALLPIINMREAESVNNVEDEYNFLLDNDLIDLNDQKVYLQNLLTASLKEMENCCDDCLLTFNSFNNLFNQYALEFNEFLQNLNENDANDNQADFIAASDTNTKKAHTSSAHTQNQNSDTIDTDYVVVEKKLRRNNSFRAAIGEIIISNENKAFPKGNFSKENNQHAVDTILIEDLSLNDNTQLDQIKKSNELLIQNDFCFKKPEPIGFYDTRKAMATMAATTCAPKPTQKLISKTDTESQDSKVVKSFSMNSINLSQCSNQAQYGTLNCRKRKLQPCASHATLPINLSVLSNSRAQDLYESAALNSNVESFMTSTLLKSSTLDRQKQTSHFCRKANQSFNYKNDTSSNIQTSLSPCASSLNNLSSMLSFSSASLPQEKKYYSSASSPRLDNSNSDSLRTLRTNPNYYSYMNNACSLQSISLGKNITLNSNEHSRDHDSRKSKFLREMHLSLNDLTKKFILNCKQHEHLTSAFSVNALDHKYFGISDYASDFKLKRQQSTNLKPLQTNNEKIKLIEFFKSFDRLIKEYAESKKKECLTLAKEIDTDLICFIIKIFRLLVILLPPENKRKLHFLLRFLNHLKLVKKAFTYLIKENAHVEQLEWLYGDDLKLINQLDIANESMTLKSTAETSNQAEPLLSNKVSFGFIKNINGLNYINEVNANANRAMMLDRYMSEEIGENVESNRKHLIKTILENKSKIVEEYLIRSFYKSIIFIDDSQEKEQIGVNVNENNQNHKDQNSFNAKLSTSEKHKMGMKLVQILINNYTEIMRIPVELTSKMQNLKLTNLANDANDNEKFKENSIPSQKVENQDPNQIVSNANANDYPSKQQRKQSENGKANFSKEYLLNLLDKILKIKDGEAKLSYLKQFKELYPEVYEEKYPSFKKALNILGLNDSCVAMKSTQKISKKSAFNVGENELGSKKSKIMKFANQSINISSFTRSRGSSQTQTPIQSVGSQSSGLSKLFNANKKK